MTDEHERLGPVDLHELAHAARAAGLTWAMIARLLGYKDASGAFRAAQSYARRQTAAPAPAETRAARAYAAGMAGESWETIARTLEYANGTSARTCARSYATAAGLPLPPRRRAAARPARRQPLCEDSGSS